MATRNIAYGTSAALTITAGSLTNTSVRSSAVVDNTSAKAVDELLAVSVTLAAGAPSTGAAVNIYLYGSEDGTNYSGSSGEGIDGTDKAVTLSSPTNLKGPFVMATPDNGGTFKEVFSVARMFGGNVPRKWGIVVQNSTGQSFSAFSASHTPVTETIA